MSRKRLKQILLVAGIVIFAAGLAVFLLDISSFSSQRPRGFRSLMYDVILPFYVFSLVSITALSIAAFMHSKDVTETKPGLSSVLKTFSCFWMVGGALSAAALIFIAVFFMA